MLSDDRTRVGADSGYHTTEHIWIDRPWTKPQQKGHPERAAWNKVFNRDRAVIERSFGIFEETWRIFDGPWRRDRHLFPLALRVALKLMNRYWSLPGINPPGAEARLKEL